MSDVTMSSCPSWSMSATIVLPSLNHNVLGNVYVNVAATVTEFSELFVRE